MSIRATPMTPITGALGILHSVPLPASFPVIPMPYRNVTALSITFKIKGRFRITPLNAHSSAHLITTSARTAHKVTLIINASISLYHLSARPAVLLAKGKSVYKLVRYAVWQNGYVSLYYAKSQK